MELLDRYLQAVKFWLPAKQKEDIAQELADDLESQFAERRDELGRDLTEDEIAEIIERCGNPLEVGSRYRPQQQLIGPVLFPIYWFVLKMVFFCYLVPWWLVGVSLLILWPGYRAGHSLLSVWMAWWNVAFYLTGMITLGFAVADKINAKTGYLSKWNVRKLPPVKDFRKIPRGSSFGELLGSLGLLVYWILPTQAPILQDKGVVIHWVPGPVSQSFHGTCFWPVLLFAVLSVAQSVVNIARPYWTRSRMAFRAVVHLAGLSVLAAVIIPHWTEVTSSAAKLTAHDVKLHYSLAEMTMGWSNIGAFTGAIVTAIVLAGSFAWEAIRTILWKEVGSPL